MSDTINSFVYWLHLQSHQDILSQGYVGVSIDPTSRFNEHKGESTKLNPTNLVLARAFKKYSTQIVQDIVFAGSNTECYAFEERIRPVSHIGWNINKGGICPPSQKGIQRSALTREKIKNNSSKQGAERTIDYVKKHQDVIYKVLSMILERNRCTTILEKTGITRDLYNKIKKKYLTYIDILNTHTDYTLVAESIKKTNGMQQKVFSDKKELLIKLYRLINLNVKRKDILNELSISPAFYGRFKNKELEFISYYNSNSADYVEA